MLRHVVEVDGEGTLIKEIDTFDSYLSSLFNVLSKFCPENA